MNYRTLREAIDDLEKNGHLVRIKEPIDPHLEMATLHLRLFARGGPALLFENVKGSMYQCASNLFGTIERSRFIFRDTFAKVQQLVQLRNDPMKALRRPLRYASTAVVAWSALPKKSGFQSAGFKEIRISDLPQIRHWPDDGGAFVTLPQVYTEDIDQPGVMHSNLGMYRIQLSGNEYETDREIGLHYQIHRGIGVHQSKCARRGVPMRVSIFVGGPPSHTLAAVMPLPEGISELTFAGALGGRRFRYAMQDGYCISLDADFVITGDVYPGENKAEGPFGDHLGYYSLKHPFPLMRIKKVYAKKNAIWPFTVVGRPPQEDTAFGKLIHELSGTAIPHEIPGVKAVHAVDAAGVHPLLLATGSERYTPYLDSKRPAELLTQANRILGTGQLSLAKYLFIAAGNEKEADCHNEASFLQYVFERIDFTRDLHFQTKTTIDTLDYSGGALNEGSKVVIAAYGDKKRELLRELPESLQFNGRAKFLLPGVMGLSFSPFRNYEAASEEMSGLADQLREMRETASLAQVVVYDDFDFNPAQLLRDYLWLTYTRTNPSHDIYGVEAFVSQKHWGCKSPLIFDARRKPHHAPGLQTDPSVERAIDRFFIKGSPLEKWG